MAHYNGHRFHRSLALVAPASTTDPPVLPLSAPNRIQRIDRLGGLVHEYHRVAG